MSANPNSRNMFIALMVAGLVVVVGYMFYVSYFTSQKLEKDESAVIPGCPLTEPDPSVVPVEVELMLKDGPVVMALRKDLAPKHVERLVTLASDGFYDGIVFHRVIEGFMAQTGDPTGTGTGGSDLPDLPCEFSTQPFTQGTIGMARAYDPNSANSQFFIMFADGDGLFGQYSVVGEVISGMEYVNNIKKGDAGNNGLVQDPDKIISMRVLP